MIDSIVMRVVLLTFFYPVANALKINSDGLASKQMKIHVRNNSSERVLIVMTDFRSLELPVLAERGASLLTNLFLKFLGIMHTTLMWDTGIQARCDEGHVSYWTNNFLKTAQASISSGFDFKYFQCVDRRADAMKDKFPIDAHWCKAVVMKHVLTEGAYDKVIVVDSDAYVNSFQPGLLENVFDVLATGKQFMVPDPESGSFRSASLANASVITDIAHTCGLSSGGKHCTAVLLMRNNNVAKAIVHDWLAKYQDGLGAPYYDQHAFNMLVPKYGSGNGMEVFASDLVCDHVAKDGRAEACFQHFEYNTQLLKDYLGTPEVSVFVHRQKQCESSGAVIARIGADLQLILQRSSDMVQEIEVGYDIQRRIENDQ
jgi:hypothetical protein